MPVLQDYAVCTNVHKKVDWKCFCLDIVLPYI